MRVLIISPHFPPVNAPDMHRVRLLIPHLRECGVAVEVLAVNEVQVDYPSDSRLLAGLPGDVPVHRVNALGLGWKRLPGFGSIGFRAMRALAKRGDALLTERHFDLIYFSTTVFEVHGLGVGWQRKFGIPFLMDFQDPWVNDYYREHPEVQPPGGRLKYGLMRLLHRQMEPWVLRKCSGITSVSPAYPAQLSKRYPWLEIDVMNHGNPPHGTGHFLPARVMPFPGDASELERVIREHTPQTIFKTSGDRIHWVYAGVFIPGMSGALRSLFRALLDHGSRDLLDRLHIHFIGTCYAPGGEAVVLPLAEEFGMEHLVDERTARIAYTEVLACLRDADALLVLGSDDAGYTASKVYPYLLAQKPLLTIMHEASSVVTLMKQVGGGVCVRFSDASSSSETIQMIAEQWLKDDRWQCRVALDEAAFRPYTAGYQARVLTDFFQTIISQSSRVTSCV
jgi:hypothetical protein